MELSISTSFICKLSVRSCPLECEFISRHVLRSSNVEIDDHVVEFVVVVDFDGKTFNSSLVVVLPLLIEIVSVLTFRNGKRVDK